MVRALASAALSCLVLLAPGPTVGARPVVGSEATSLAERSLAKRPASRLALEAAVGALVELHPLAIDELAGEPAAGGVAALYNRVLGRVVEALEARAGARQESETLVLETAGGRALLRWAANVPPFFWRPQSHRLVPAGELRSSFATRAAGDGLGAPCVAVRRAKVPRMVRPDGGWFPSYSYFYPVTVVAAVGEGPDGLATVELRLVDPRLADQVEVDGRRLPLAFDLSAQLAAAIAEAKVGSRGVKGLRRAERLLPELGLFLPEPFKPEKIPVVFVHGLASTPATWFEAYNALIADPRIRSTYQFWFFNYPSGLPFSYSAQLLRSSLRKTVADLDPELANPNLSRMVLVGHSMGGSCRGSRSRRAAIGSGGPSSPAPSRSSRSRIATPPCCAPSTSSSPNPSSRG